MALGERIKNAHASGVGLRDTPIDGNGVAKDAKVYSHFVTI